MPILFTTEVNAKFDAGEIQRAANWEEVAEVLICLLEKEIALSGVER